MDISETDRFAKNVSNHTCCCCFVLSFLFCFSRSTTDQDSVTEITKIITASSGSRCIWVIFRSFNEDLIGTKILELSYRQHQYFEDLNVI